MVLKVKAFLSLFAIIGFIMLELGNKTTVADGAPEIIRLAAVLEAETSLLGGWSVYSRDYIGSSDSSGELEEYADELQRLFPDWEWTISAGRHKWEAAAVSPASEYGRESIQLVSTRTPHGATAYIIYKVTGGEWNGKSAAFFETGAFAERLNDIFRGEPSIFSCIEGTFSDRMEKALPEKVTRIMGRLNASEKEAIREKDFISVSAFSPFFADSLKNGMNVQIAVRSAGGQGTITFGTPIITVEY